MADSLAPSSATYFDARGGEAWGPPLGPRAWESSQLRLLAGRLQRLIEGRARNTEPVARRQSRFPSHVRVGPQNIS